MVIFLVWGFIMVPYRLPHLKYEGYAVYTNNPIRAPQRGHGAPQLRFAVDSQLDMIAEELGLDPIEIRLKNSREPGETLPNGDSVHNCGLRECIEKAAERTRFQQKYSQNRSAAPSDDSRRRGIGIGVSSYMSGTLIYPNSSSAMVKMNDDGSVTLLTGALDIGQGAETILSQIVAEELKIPVEEIQVIAADTETTPVDIGSWISGNAYVTGNATRVAATEVRKKLLDMAAEEIEANVMDLVLGDKYVYVAGSPQRKLSYRNLGVKSIIFSPAAFG